VRGKRLTYWQKVAVTAVFGWTAALFFGLFSESVPVEGSRSLHVSCGSVFFPGSDSDACQFVRTGFGFLTVSFATIGAVAGGMYLFTPGENRRARDRAEREEWAREDSS
jgi:hypothetical protein